MNDRDLSTYISILLVLILCACVLLGVLIYNTFFAKDPLTLASEGEQVAALPPAGISEADLRGTWFFKDEDWDIQMVFEEEDKIALYAAESSGEDGAADYESGATWFGAYTLEDSAIKVIALTGFSGDLEAPPPYISDGDHSYPYKYNQDAKILSIMFSEEAGDFAFTR